MTEQISRLWAALEAARKRLTLSTQNGGGKAESEYAAVYARLVSLGAAAPLRKKYR